MLPGMRNWFKQWILNVLPKLRYLPRGQKFVAKKTITILPEKYRAGEERVLEIIKNLPYANRLPDIQYEFFN